MLDFCVRWPGRRRALAVVDFASAAAESALESVSRVVFAEMGVPGPRLQVVISGERGTAGRVDFRWGRLIGEADGLLKYDEPLALHREKLRQMALEDLGFEVVRWTWAEIWAQPEVVVRRLQRAFARVGQPWN